MVRLGREALGSILKMSNLTIFYTYVLINPKNILYKGVTDDLEKRLHEHNNYKNRWTSGKGTWKLVYYEKFNSRSEALKREKFFKSGEGREFLKSII